jgi:hypothetical protein
MPRSRKGSAVSDSGVLDFLPAGLAEVRQGRKPSVVRSADWRSMGCPWVAHGLRGDSSGTPI